LGIKVVEPLESLGEIRQAGGKTVLAFALERDLDPSVIVSNTVEIDWPPRSGRKLTVPEIDQARWFSVDEARRHILPSQAPLLDRLAAIWDHPAPAGVQMHPAKEMIMTELSANDRNELDKGSFAFAKQRKEPLENASHVRNAIERFNQVKDVTDEERDAAWKRIKAAAKKFSIDATEKSWREIGK
jgi:hypothetical protein